MADEIAYFEFPGIEAVESADYTLAHGITPGVCTIKCRPQNSLPSLLPSPLSISYGGERFTLSNCIIDQGEVSADGSGQIAVVRILDRRWKWRFPTISGRYNVYDQNGTLDVSTEKPPRDLARLCLEAMGERNFSVDQIPNDIRPFVDWDYDNAAESLESLAEACGCRVAYCLDDRVRIVRVGVGRSLPVGGTVERNVNVTDLAEAPDRLTFIGGPDMFQADLPLEAVGRDITGERLKLLADLSYKPAADWDAADLEFLNEITDAKLRELALSSVFKLYRVQIPDGGLTVPGYDKKINSLKQLELLGVQIASETINGEERPKEPIIYGVWFNERDDGQNSVTGSIVPIANDPTSDADKSALYPYGFSINDKEFTVQFSDTVYKQAQDGDRMEFGAAELRLRIAFYIRDEVTGAYFYTTKNKPTGYANGTKPRVIREPNLTRKRYPEYGDSFDVFSVVDNKADFDRDAQEYLDSAFTEYQRRDPHTVTYAGLRFDIGIDGAVQQISWSVPGGNAYATTTVYRNNDISDVMPSYTQMRYRRKLQGGLETLKRLAGAAGDAATAIGRTIFGGAK